MALVVRAVPLVPGREAELRELARKLLGERREEAIAFYTRFGIVHESWHLQTTPHGSWVIGVTQLETPSLGTSARRYSESEHPFDRWFKDQVHRLSGINPDERPLGPPTECVYDTGSFVARPRPREAVDVQELFGEASEPPASPLP